jgi:hypothetical protein
MRSARGWQRPISERTGVPRPPTQNVVDSEMRLYLVRSDELQAIELKIVVHHIKAR